MVTFDLWIDIATPSHPCGLHRAGSTGYTDSSRKTAHPMSMIHKAFVFEYDAFQSDLRAKLEQSLQTGDVEPLQEFIQSNRSRITDPYEGEPLADDWESLIESKDAHKYGDFALTRYYDPREDIGLGADWDRVDDLVGSEGTAIVLGTPFGPSDNPFDPGKMGSYLQTLPHVFMGVAIDLLLPGAQ